MKYNNTKLNLITLLLFYSCITSYSQDWYEDLYHETTEKSIDENYQNIWLSRTYQGIIGSKYQRIEVRFLTIKKNTENPHIYEVSGKTKVNNNICDFNGKLIVEKIKTLKDSNDYGDSPEISTGMLWGKYILNENPSQNHVGIFEGKFYAKYDLSETGIAEAFSDLYYDNYNLTFQGTWQEYNSTDSKRCNWGWNIPPESEHHLFNEYENGTYIINQQYLDKGWRSYAIANSWIIIPKDYNITESRYKDDFIEYSSELIKENKVIESKIWWK